MSSSDSPATIVPGYELGEEIGRGGMGVVYRAHDPDFGRDVAIKLLSAEVSADSFAATRFRTEARITGQLQHPGIPAVHKLGALEDGKPFLAMKLVKGQTLQKLLDRRGEATDDRGRCIAIFEQVCQAVGYAHAHLVIHRDLKPANIMVGAHGEVQVMDWGLAKVLGENAKDEEESHGDDLSTAAFVGRAIDTPKGGDSATRTGSVLGTPAYMPPEQAGGEIRKLDARSDVFELGAMLCQILTGQPPYVGRDANDTRIKAVRGELQEAITRLNSCGAEPDLISLCKECLAFKQDDRPADGQAVATEVGRVRTEAESRARQAEMERGAALVHEAEERKRKKAIQCAAGMVALVLLVGVVGTSTGLYSARRAAIREADRADSESKAKRQAELAAEAEKKANVRAQAMTKLALDSNNEMVFGLQGKLETQPGTQDLRKFLLESARGGLAKFMEEARKEGKPDHTLVISYFRMGDLELNLGNTVEAKKEFDDGHKMALGLAEANPKDPAAQRDLSVSYERLGLVTLRLGQTKESLEFYQKGLGIDQRLAEADPKNAQAQRDLSVIYERLGDVKLQLGQTKEALEFQQKNLEIDQRLAEADPKNAVAQRDLSISYNKLGEVSLRLGQTKESLEFHQKGLEIVQRLAEADSKNAQAQRDLSVSYERLGDVAVRLGEMKEALEFRQKGLEIGQRLAEADPKNAQAQRDLSVMYWKIAVILEQSFEFAKATEMFERAEILAAGFSKPGFFPKDLPWLHTKVAVCRNAEKVIADLEFTFTLPVEQISKLLFVRLRALLHRKQPEGAIATAERFAEWAEKQEKGRDEQRYNAACAFALCASGEKPDEALIDKAIGLLEKAKAGGYFDEKYIAHIKQDADFNSIRNHPKFVAFVAGLEGK